MASDRPTRTVVVTGGSSGIGLCTARAFAARGDNVVLVARGAQRLAAAAEQCRTFGGGVIAVNGDVTDAARMRHVAEAAIGTFGGVDVWVNNAGTSLWGPFADVPVEVHGRLVEVDLIGVVNGAHAILPHFLDRDAGVLINVVSIAGRLPGPWATSYSAAKFGVAGFTDALRLELRTHSRVAVCGVYPAFVDTPTAVTSGNYTGRTLRPVPPVVTPERVAAAIIGLADRPRRARRVGALHLASLPYAVAPRTTGSVTARLARRYFLAAGDPDADTPGGLFAPQPGPAAARGGWGEPQRARLRRVAAGATLGVTVLAAAALARTARRR